MRRIRGELRRAGSLLGILLLLGACTGEPSVSDVSAQLVEAIARSRAAGTVRTTTTMPAGVLPTTRITGAVDLTRGRSETFIEIHRGDGAVLPYGRVVRTAGAMFLGQYLGQGELVWQRSGGEAEEEDFAAPNFDGLLVLRELERQAPRLRPDPDAEGRYRVVSRPETGGPTRRGLLVTSARVGSDGRIAEVAVIIPSMADAGAFRMAFAAYGEPVRITVPAV